MSEYTWTPALREVPPEGLTVDLCNERWPAEKVWPGTYEGGQWIDGHGLPLLSSAHSGRPDAQPTHWRHRPSLPVSGGVVKIVYVMTSRPGALEVLTRTEFEPKLESVEGSAAGGLWVALTKALAAIIERGGQPK